MGDVSSEEVKDIESSVSSGVPSKGTWGSTSV